MSYLVRSTAERTLHILEGILSAEQTDEVEKPLVPWPQGRGGHGSHGMQAEPPLRYFDFSIK